MQKATSASLPVQGKGQGSTPKPEAPERPVTMGYQLGFTSGPLT